MHDKLMCESIDGDRRDVEQNPLAGDNEQWINKEADTYADHEEEELNGDEPRTRHVYCVRRRSSLGLPLARSLR